MQKKYSVNMENDEIVSVEVDGVIYKNIDDIPDLDDRAQVMFLADNHDMEWEKERFLQDTHPSKAPVLLFGLFFGIGMLMLAISAFSFFNAITSMAKEVSLPGQVVNMVHRTSSDGDTYYYPEVEFTLPDKSTKRLQLSEGSWPPAYEVGQQVTVRYNAEQPMDANIQSPTGTLMRFLLSMITGIIGIAFTGVSLVVFRMMKHQREEMQAEGQVRIPELS